MTRDLVAKLNPPNSLILLTSSVSPSVPILDGILVASTATCIAVGTLMELDGETEVRLTDSLGPGHHLELALEHELSTGEGFVAIRTADDREVLRREVDQQTQLVRVWVSDPWEPDEVVIELIST